MTDRLFWSAEESFFVLEDLVTTDNHHKELNPNIAMAFVILVEDCTMQAIILHNEQKIQILNCIITTNPEVL